jgi:hypothetical protein
MSGQATTGGVKLSYASTLRGPGQGNRSGALAYLRAVRRGPRPMPQEPTSKPRVEPALPDDPREEPPRVSA